MRVVLVQLKNHQLAMNRRAQNGLVGLNGENAIAHVAEEPNTELDHAHLEQLVKLDVSVLFLIADTAMANHVQAGRTGDHGTHAVYHAEADNAFKKEAA